MTRQCTWWLGIASVLMVACGDDSGMVMTTSGSDSEGGGTTTDVGDSTGHGETTAMTMPGSSDDGSSTTTDVATSTGMAESSTGSGVECGNGVIDADEVCDGTDLAGADCLGEGFDDGDLACAADCSGYDTTGCNSFMCGDGVQERGEVCDQGDFGGATCQSEGFDNGSLGCALACDSLDTAGCGICGNIIVDGDEVCDDIVLFGETCESQGFDSGDLGCSADCLSYVTVGCGTCGNDFIDGGELCDNLDNGGEDCLSLGFDSGTLGACQSSCSDFDTAGCGMCSNDVIDGDEFCDGSDLAGESCVTQGFDNGQLACVPDCSAYTTAGCGVCGNMLIDGGESCDGALLGGESCASLGLIGGTLGCSPTCQYDFAACDIPGMPFGNDTGYNGFSLSPPTLPCDDISATGTATGLSDDSYTNAPLGFTFNMYGVPFTDIYIASNGTAYFGTDANLNLSNICMPGDTPYVVDDNILAVFWDDLNPGAAGDVYYQTLGPIGTQRFVVQWDVPHFAGDLVDLIRVQVMFNETGAIEVCYPDTINAGNFGDNGAQATAGIQQNIATGFEYSCDAPNLVDGLMLLYLPV